MTGPLAKQNGLDMFKALTTDGRETLNLSEEPAGIPKSPQERSVVEHMSLPGVRRLLLGNAAAGWKSAEILISGSRVFNAAAFALTLTAIEDAQALYRARQSCRSTLALVAVERDHAVLAAVGAGRRLGLMTRIARDLAEEAAYPLRTRLDAVIANLHGAACA